MLLEVILFIIGLVVLLKSSDWVVDGASILAKKFGTPDIFIGLTIVAFGTSLPELIVAVISVLNGSSQIIFGNVVGSNIANILLVLGVTSIYRGVKLNKPTIWKEIPFVLFATFILYLLTNQFFMESKQFLTIADGLVFLSLFAIFLYYLFVDIRSEPSRKIAKKSRKPHKDFESSFMSIEKDKLYLPKLLAGLVGIYFGALWVVGGVEVIAAGLGISQFLVSVVAIALGTSLPELAVCLNAAKKDKMDLVIGNILGSNIFNILWIFGVALMISPIAIPTFISIDIAIAFFAALVLFVLMFIGKKHELRREDGILLVLFYVAYIVYVIFRG